MTTGSLTNDSRVLTSTGVGVVPAGRYYSRIWNGADWPKTQRTYTQYSVPMAKGRSYRVRRGQRVIVYTQAYKLRRYRNVPPRRARNEEHSYSATVQEFNDSVFSWNNAPPSTPDGDKGWRTTTHLGAFGTPVTYPTWSSDDDIALLGKLREKIAGSSFNAGVSLGESKEALHLIFNSANRIARSLHALKRGNFHAAARELSDLQGVPRSRARKGPKRVADQWLELQYGWLPLLNDAKEGAEFLAHLHSYPSQQVVRVSRQAKQETQGWKSAMYDSKSTMFDRKTIKAILTEVDTVALAGLTDPLSVAWELLPYSFVADWFIPIGNYLSARGLAQSITGTFVITQTRKLHLKLVDGRWDPSWEFKDTGDWFWKLTETSRTISNSLQVPTPTIKPLSKIVGWRHAANAVALLVGNHRS